MGVILEWIKAKWRWHRYQRDLEKWERKCLNDLLEGMINYGAEKMMEGPK